MSDLERKPRSYSLGLADLALQPAASALRHSSPAAQPQVKPAHAEDKERQSQQNSGEPVVAQGAPRQMKVFKRDRRRHLLLVTQIYYVNDQ